MAVHVCNLFVYREFTRFVDFGERHATEPRLLAWSSRLVGAHTGSRKLPDDTGHGTGLEVVGHLRNRIRCIDQATSAGRLTDSSNAKPRVEPFSELGTGVRPTR